MFVLGENSCQYVVGIIQKEQMSVATTLCPVLKCGTHSFTSGNVFNEDYFLVISVPMNVSSGWSLEWQWIFPEVYLFSGF